MLFLNSLAVPTYQGSISHVSSSQKPLSLWSHFTGYLITNQPQEGNTVEKTQCGKILIFIKSESHMTFNLFSACLKDFY
jgi:hypothetical protein